MIKNNSIFLTLVALMGSLAALSQRGSGDSLKPGDVHIFREYEPRIQDAFKLSDNPKVEDTVIKIDQNVPYEVRSKRIQTSFDPQPIKPAKMKGEPLSKLYKAYALLGIGNYLTTRGELVINNTRSRKWDYGLKAWHHGSRGNVKDRGYSGFTDNYFTLYGKKFFYNNIVSGKLDYDLNSTHYYGFDPSAYNSALLDDSLGKKDIAQNFQNVSPELRFKTYYKDSSKFNFDFGVKYNHYWDKYNSVEDNVIIDGTIDRYFNTEFAQVSAFLDFNSFKYDRFGTRRKDNNTLFGLKPRIFVDKGKLQFRIGAEVVMSSGVGQDFFLYPDLYLKYDLVEKIIIPYAGINGSVKRNNYRNLTRVNPFLETDPITSLENTKYNVFAGVRGELASYLSFNAGLSFKQVDNLALFVNEIDSLGGVALYNRFKVRYDDVQIGTLTAELGYQKIKRFSLLLKGEYFFYNLKNEKEAWQMPNLKISFNGTYNISDKIRLTADVFYIGERYAWSLVAAGNKNYGNGEYGIKLDPLFDLNLGAEYFINPRWTAFARFYNLTNSRYAIYNEYYQQGITFMVGTTYKFWGSKKRVK